MYLHNTTFSATYLAALYSYVLPWHPYQYLLYIYDHLMEGDLK